VPEGEGACARKRTPASHRPAKEPGFRPRSARRSARLSARLALRRLRHSTALDGPKNISINNMSGGVMKNDNTTVPKYPMRRSRPKYPVIKHRRT
jgi:hypothetical protein